MGLLGLRFVAAQLGLKPGSRQALAMLLDADDLPGGPWRRLDQRTWRTGLKSTDPWSARAREIRSITAWRSFEDASTSRWLWIQAVPFASARDALLGLDSVPDNFLRNLRAEVEPVTETVPKLPSIPGVDKMWATEQETSSSRGDGRALMLGCAVGSMVIILAASSFGEGWTWDGLVNLSTRQISRLHGRDDTDQR